MDLPPLQKDKVTMLFINTTYINCGVSVMEFHVEQEDVLRLGEPGSITSTKSSFEQESSLIASSLK